ncbi:hypothetical protein APY04_0341 [Hyphomicrobium sulfonivorans]|uniref:Uncharacterized protein n=1 Tax=Hyphomicrobium sulfonivorans TaxID=121290 RepID=A0A125NW80_HYPSL|nr:hypothetical protein APY04_0341 [Hyphomicrobium sulfonivorans]
MSAAVANATPTVKLEASSPLKTPLNPVKIYNARFAAGSTLSQQRSR